MNKQVVLFFFLGILTGGSVALRLTSLSLRDPPMSLLRRTGVPCPLPIREEGVPYVRGELRSISEVGRLVMGGEEKRGRPWLAGLDGWPGKGRE